MLTQVAVETASSPVLAGTLIPLIVSLVAKCNLDSRLKALLAGVMAVGVALFNSKGVIDQVALEDALKTLGSAVVAYKGIFEHLGTNKMLPNFGIGPKAVVEAEPGDPEFVEGEDDGEG